MSHMLHSRLTVTLLTLVSLSSLTMHAQESRFLLGEATSSTATPQALLQFATITASGNSLTASWIPVINSSGYLIYKNLQFQFDVDASGNLTIAPGYPQLTSAPMLTTVSFKAGKYVGPSTVYSGQFTVNVSGPAVTTGGATEWTLAAASGANSCTYPGTATWYVGSIASSPLAARLKAAGISSTAWSYGVMSVGDYCQTPWPPNGLIGVSQVGNSITIVSFSDNNGDHSEPTSQITYTLSQ